MQRLVLKSPHIWPNLAHKGLCSSYCRCNEFEAVRVEDAYEPWRKGPAPSPAIMDLSAYAMVGSV
eukprot:5250851-Ditylum_brightwellii.AAC.1